MSGAGVAGRERQGRGGHVDDKTTVTAVVVALHRAVECSAERDATIGRRLPDRSDL